MLKPSAKTRRGSKFPWSRDPLTSGAGGTVGRPPANGVGREHRLETPVDRFYMCAVGLVSSRPQTHMWVPHLDLEAPPGSLSLGLTVSTLVVSPAKA